MTGAPGSWGRQAVPAPARVQPFAWRHEALPTEGTLLAYGCGRSYGDTCLNDGGTLLTTGHLDRVVSFDATTGVLRAEAGMTLGAIAAFAVPQGWRLAVVPGTRFVTLGGAIANDVHGKNHHRAGSFGHHVRAFELLRSDGSRTVCQPGDAYFAATVGGLGLTGLVTWAEVQLVPVRSPWMRAQLIPFDTLGGFFAINAESTASHEYTVAWVDGLGAHAGRGHYIRADHVTERDESLALWRPREPGVGVPFDLPGWVLNATAMRAFNTLKFHGASRSARESRVDMDSYFHPLDAIGGWNRIYGRRGFLQHQSVVPAADAQVVVGTMLREVARAGEGSFLAVLKGFGDQPSPGLLSFARPGITLAMDFPLRGPATLALLDRLDAIVRGAGGAIYPAKDARMSAETFRSSFPQWSAFAAHVDPRFGSNFWRRVGGTA